ncbi:hypothetical protein ABIA38_001856 [Embleya sp. AB8]
MTRPSRNTGTAPGHAPWGRDVRPSRRVISAGRPGGRSRLGVPCRCSPPRSSPAFRPRVPLPCGGAGGPDRGVARRASGRTGQSRGTSGDGWAICAVVVTGVARARIRPTRCVRPSARAPASPAGAANRRAACRPARARDAPHAWPDAPCGNACRAGMRGRGEDGHGRMPPERNHASRFTVRDRSGHIVVPNDKFVCAVVRIRSIVNPVRNQPDGGTSGFGRGPRLGCCWRSPEPCRFDYGHLR